MRGSSGDLGALGAKLLNPRKSRCFLLNKTYFIEACTAPLWNCIPQYPEEAIRESIVNAIMHRDYFEKSGDVLVEIFRTRINVSNPGGLVSWMKQEDFGVTSRPRNILIANLLAKTIYVEKLGTGINRIRKAMSGAKLPKPEFRFNSSFFITLYDKTFK